MSFLNKEEIKIGRLNHRCLISELYHGIITDLKHFKTYYELQIETSTKVEHHFKI